MLTQHQCSPHQYYSFSQHQVYSLVAITPSVFSVLGTHFCLYSFTYDLCMLISIPSYFRIICDGSDSFFSLHSLSVLIRSLFAQIFVAIQFNMDVRCIAWCDTLNMLPHSFSSTTTAAAAHCDAAQRIAYMQSHTAHCRFSC